MDFKEIADKAYRNKPIDEFVSLPIKYAYLQLKELYSEFRNGEISKEKCIPLKRKIEIEYANNVAEYERFFQVFKKYNEDKILNETLVIAIQKANTKEEALEESLKIIGNYLNDSSFHDRILEKFKNK